MLRFAIIEFDSRGGSRYQYEYSAENAIQAIARYVNDTFSEDAGASTPDSDGFFRIATASGATVRAVVREVVTNSPVVL